MVQIDGATDLFADEWFEVNHADLREKLGRMIPPPDTRLLQEKLISRFYAVMKPLGRFEEDDSSDEAKLVKSTLTEALKIVAHIGNWILVDRAIWRWDWDTYGADADKVIITCPGLRQVRDYASKPVIDDMPNDEFIERRRRRKAFELKMTGDPEQAVQYLFNQEERRKYMGASDFRTHVEVTPLSDGRRNRTIPRWLAAKMDLAEV